MTLPSYFMVFRRRRGREQEYVEDLRVRRAMITAHPGVADEGKASGVRIRVFSRCISTTEISSGSRCAEIESVFPGGGWRAARAGDA